MVVLTGSGPYRKYQTMYALTDRRVMVVRKRMRGTSVRSLPLQFIERVDVDHPLPDARGTLLIYPRNCASGGGPIKFYRVRGCPWLRGRIIQGMERLRGLD